jgi:hypothetical protein
MALALAGLWLAFSNPGIDGTSRGDNYTCSAPYDTVLNDADNVPGGEPTTDGDDNADRCQSVGQERFGLAVGAVAAAILAGAFLVLVWHRSRTNVPTPTT